MALWYIAALIIGRCYETLTARRCILQAGYKQEIRRGGEVWRLERMWSGREAVKARWGNRNVTSEVFSMWLCDPVCCDQKIAIIQWLFGFCENTLEALRCFWWAGQERRELPYWQMQRGYQERKWRQTLVSSSYSKASCARQDRGPLMEPWGSLHTVPVTSTAFMADG